MEMEDGGRREVMVAMEVKNENGEGEEDEDGVERIC